MQCFMIAKSFSKEPAQMAALMQRITAFKQSKKFTMRQTFITMCESVILGDPHDQSLPARVLAEQIFADHFLPSFAELKSDRIVNVRLHVSQILAVLFRHSREILNDRSSLSPSEYGASRLCANE